MRVPVCVCVALWHPTDLRSQKELQFCLFISFQSLLFFLVSVFEADKSQMCLCLS